MENNSPFSILHFPFKKMKGAFSHFKPDLTVIDAVPVGDGNINDTFRVTTAGKEQPQSWLVQRLNTQVFTRPHEVMANWTLVAEHLVGLGADYPLQVPIPIPDQQGKVLFEDAAGMHWRLFPFFEDTYAPERLPDAEEAYEAARAYGIFARSLQGIAPTNLYETIPGFHNTDQRWVRFEQVIADDPAGRVSGSRALIEAMFAVKPVFDRISHLKSTVLPLRATHNDTKAGNVLLHTASRKAAAVIDWDTIMPGVILSDFGDMVRTFASDQYEDDPNFAHLSVRKTVFEAMISGFLDETANLLTPEERQNLMLGGEWIIGEQVLRFFTDYLAGDVYYKIAYPEHNLVRTQNQLALLHAVQRYAAGL